MEILLTNDDGIDATGLGVLHEALSSVADVTAVAPADDQSAVGRAMSHEVTVDEHALGYAVHGTPTDCVVAGVQALPAVEPDLVVAGCNRGANLGEYVLGRSGTVSAAVESAFLGVPAMAVSLYLPADLSFAADEPGAAGYADAALAAEYLVEGAFGAGVFEEADYLNVNAPLAAGGAPAPLEVTCPSHVYAIDAEHEPGTVTIRDHIWERMATGVIDDPAGTDRRAVVEGRVSVSPLVAPHSTRHHEALDGLVDAYPDGDPVETGGKD